ncbi:unnamed protein product [Linum tenue]|uniref:Uncharacterized protein n=1 Tax=Linum tenue TaxID=586396 RepID=A0AAV0IIV4_9ROSI|nr:unnamed protein product [Linum tenue]
MEELQMKPLDDVKDQEFESDFEDTHPTDDEIDDLYSARDIVVKRMMKDEYFNMDDKKWDEMVNEAMGHGIIKDTRECEELLEDMLNWDKLLPGRVVSPLKINIVSYLRELYCHFENIAFVHSTKDPGADRALQALMERSFDVAFVF